jgi:probable rRNA maturation factor
MAARKRTAKAATAAAALSLDLQLKSRAAHVPSRRQFAAWINKALLGRVDVPVEITLRVVGPTEMRALNREYRGKDYATNVLSFPFEAPKGITLPVRVLGDIVLCAATVQHEAREQGKAVEAHWAHLTVHGVLHLLGLDHQTPRHANVMEGAEIAILALLGFGNPYLLPAPSLQSPE